MGDHCVCPTGTTGVDCAEQPKLEVGGFLDRLLSSKFRTADPSQADYFFVPQVGFGNRMKSLEYVQTAFETHWNRKQGKDHIMIGTHDAGLQSGMKRGGYTGNHIVVRLS
eukprot:gene10728-12694_t